MILFIFLRFVLARRRNALGVFKWRWKFLIFSAFINITKKNETSWKVSEFRVTSMQSLQRLSLTCVFFLIWNPDYEFVFTGEGWKQTFFGKAVEYQKNCWKYRFISPHHHIGTIQKQRVTYIFTRRSDGIVHNRSILSKLDITTLRIASVKRRISKILAWWRRVWWRDVC